ncbi:peptide chain release factor H [Tahibacter amnicola]|uniref:Peptide chain release factor H n=1 Tax=Tahibacter amnicola TaxID=2976241 RepID=A0ABY6BIX9_9GAMM|nr:peptide chain release factor H [Tahibacter amnicola]UXI69963.1 peptide chain release factor H [Tahibacter amnicola]
MILFQLSSAQGPDECCLAVALALRRLLREAQDSGVTAAVIESVAGDRPGTYRSVLLQLEGAAAASLARAWDGTLQWICASPYRRHGRKNWFIGGIRYDVPESIPSGSIVYETLRASGPGGQHVNRTESAVRATHVESGISVKVQSERSQHANRRLASLLILQRLQEQQQEAGDRQRAERRLSHHAVSRGNAIRIFRGDSFE